MSLSSKNQIALRAESPVITRGPPKRIEKHTTEVEDGEITKIKENTSSSLRFVDLIVDKGEGSLWELQTTQEKRFVEI